jgi:hypothetical protein
MPFHRFWFLPCDPADGKLDPSILGCRGGEAQSLLRAHRFLSHYIYNRRFPRG